MSNNNVRIINFIYTVSYKIRKCKCEVKKLNQNIYNAINVGKLELYKCRCRWSVKNIMLIILSQCNNTSREGSSSGVWRKLSFDGGIRIFMIHTFDRSERSETQLELPTTLPNQDHVVQFHCLFFLVLTTVCVCSCKLAQIHMEFYIT